MSREIPKKKKDPFRSVAELAFSKESVGKLATAIEETGFYTWDRYGRYIFVPPVKANEAAIHSDRRNELLNKLAEGYKGIEEDSDFFYEQMQRPTILSLSGWTESNLPKFEKVQEEWNHKNLGLAKIPVLSEPKGATKVWDLVAGLLLMVFGKEILDDLRKPHSFKTIAVCEKIKNEGGVTITPTTLKSYLKKAE